jgi:hypothetical protein
VESKQTLAEAVVAHARRAGALPEGRDVAVHLALREGSAGPALAGPLQIAARTAVFGRARGAQALAASLHRAISDGRSTFVHDFLSADGAQVETWKADSGAVLASPAEKGPP